MSEKYLDIEILFTDRVYCVNVTFRITVERYLALKVQSQSGAVVK